MVLHLCGMVTSICISKQAGDLQQHSHLQCTIRSHNKALRLIRCLEGPFCKQITCINKYCFF